MEQHGLSYPFLDDKRIELTYDETMEEGGMVKGDLSFRILKEHNEGWKYKTELAPLKCKAATKVRELLVCVADYKYLHNKFGISWFGDEWERSTTLRLVQSSRGSLRIIANDQGS